MAAGVITFKQVGTELPKDVVSIPFQQAVLDGKKIKGIIAILDVQYGNVWTNIPAELFNKLNVKVGNKLHVVIYKNKIKKYAGAMPYSETFGGVAKGKLLAYLNSLLQLSFALNMGNFSAVNKVYSGSEWRVEVSKQ